MTPASLGKTKGGKCSRLSQELHDSFLVYSGSTGLLATKHTNDESTVWNFITCQIKSDRSTPQRCRAFDAHALFSRFKFSFLSYYATQHYWPSIRSHVRVQPSQRISEACNFIILKSIRHVIWHAFSWCSE